MNNSIRSLVAAMALAVPLVAAAQAPVKIYNIVELSGGGATAGTNFDNGAKLAFKEINAAGGILGRKVDVISVDTQTNPGIAKALAQKAVDDGAYVVMGPVFSGSIIVGMAETKKAEIPNFTGGEAANITQQGNPYIFRTSFTQSTAMPKVAKYLKNNVKALHGAQILVKDYPGVLLDVTYDANGDLDRESFLVKVVNGKQVVTDTLPPAGK